MEPQASPQKPLSENKEIQRPLSVNASRENDSNASIHEQSDRRYSYNPKSRTYPLSEKKNPSIPPQPVQEPDNWSKVRLILVPPPEDHLGSLLLFEKDFAPVPVPLPAPLYPKMEELSLPPQQPQPHVQAQSYNQGVLMQPLQATVQAQPQRYQGYSPGPAPAPKSQSLREIPYGGYTPISSTMPSPRIGGVDSDSAEKNKNNVDNPYSRYTVSNGKNDGSVRSKLSYFYLDD